MNTFSQVHQAAIIDQNNFGVFAGGVLAPKTAIAMERGSVGRSRSNRPRFVRRMALLLTMGLSLAGVSQAADAPSATVVKIDDSSFGCIRQMVPVRHFYVDNLLGDKAATVAAANAPKGAPYPPGSVIQLVPTEVMVKREAGFSPVTNDWEFFELEVSAKESKIHKRGFAEVNNRFGKNCFGCHVPAREPWDYVCETGHGCEDIPIDHAMTGALQRTDPRCGAPEPKPGDSIALWKLRALVVIGSTIGWIKGLF